MRTALMILALITGYSALSLAVLMVILIVSLLALTDGVTDAWMYRR